MIAGDLNQLPEDTLIGKTGFIPIVKQPTRGAAFLDRIYISIPCYTSVQVVTVRSEERSQGCSCWTLRSSDSQNPNGKYEHVDWSIHHETRDLCHAYQLSSSMWGTRIHQFKMTSTNSTKYSYKLWTNSTLKRRSPYQPEIQNTWPLQSKPSLEKRTNWCAKGDWKKRAN